jgi:hypothetical protein
MTIRTPLVGQIPTFTPSLAVKGPVSPQLCFGADTIDSALARESRSKRNWLLGKIAMVVLPLLGGGLAATQGAFGKLGGSPSPAADPPAAVSHVDAPVDGGTTHVDPPVVVDPHAATPAKLPKDALTFPNKVGPPSIIVPGFYDEHGTWHPGRVVPPAEAKVVPKAKVGPAPKLEFPNPGGLPPSTIIPGYYNEDGRWVPGRVVPPAVVAPAPKGGGH